MQLRTHSTRGVLTIVLQSQAVHIQRGCQESISTRNLYISNVNVSQTASPQASLMAELNYPTPARATANPVYRRNGLLQSCEPCRKRKWKPRHDL